MSLLQASEHTFATVLTTRSEHSISLDEIDDDDDEYDPVDADSYGRGGRNRYPGGVLGDDDANDDDCSFSESTLHVFVDEWNDTSLGRSSLFVKSLAKTALTGDRDTLVGCLSHQKNLSRYHNHASVASLNKSRRIASMLYESISEMLHNSHGDMGILALDSVAKNLEGITMGGSVESQKETLANLLANGLRDLDELENRSAAPCWGPLQKSKQAVFLKQKDQLVGMLSDVFSKIEELNSATEDTESRNDTTGATQIKSPSGRAATCDAETTTSSSSRPSKKRQSSFHSDVSSITSRTTASMHHDRQRKGDKGNSGAMFNLPAALKADNKSKPKPKPKGDKPRPKPAEATSPAAPSRSSSPKASPSKQQRECGIDITLQDSFSSFCAIDADDKTPKRPQRRGSFGGAKSGPAVLLLEPDAAEVTVAAQSPPSTTAMSSSQAPRQPPLATRSLDDVVAGPRAPRRPGSRRKSDVRAAPPQRQRSFDGET